MVTDELNEFFSFKVGGFDYLLSKLGLEEKSSKISEESPDEDYFLNEGIIKKENQDAASDKDKDNKTRIIKT